MISKIMTVAPLTLPASATVGDALELLDSLEVRHVPILEGEQIVGMLSDRDLRGFRVPSRASSSERIDAELKLDTPLSEVMTRGVVVVETKDSLGAAIDTLLEHRIGAVPVVEPETGDVAGILSYVDILRYVRMNTD